MIPPAFSVSLASVVTAVALLSSVLPSSARTIRTIFVEPPPNTPEKVFLFTGKEYIETELAFKSLSAEIEIPAGQLALAVLPNKLAADAKVPEQAPKITIPESWDRCILLFFPDPANSVLKARVMPLNASQGDFPKGSTRIFNVSNAAIYAKFGAEGAKITPGQVATVKAPRSGFGDFPVAVDCMLPGETKPRALCRTSWQHDPESRQIMFVTPVEGYTVPKMWGVLDRETKPEKPR